MDEIVVSTGVKFGIRDVPVMAFRDLQKRLEQGRPHAPVHFIEDKGREEENPNDPDYQDALTKWNEETEMKLMDFVLMKGVEVTKITNGVEPIDSKNWAEECKYLGIEVADSGGVRYLQWLKYVACPTADDISKLVLGAGRKLGVTEEDVAEAATIFQNRKERRANTKPPRKAHSK